MSKSKFSAFWAIVLVFASIWFGKEMGWVSYNFDFPWIPAILLIFALAVFVNKLRK